MKACNKSNFKLQASRIKKEKNFQKRSFLEFTKYFKQSKHKNDYNKKISKESDTALNNPSRVDMPLN